MGDVKVIPPFIFLFFKIMDAKIKYGHEIFYYFFKNKLLLRGSKLYQQNRIS